MRINKYLLGCFLFLLVFLAGCSMGPAKKVTEKDAPQNLSSYNQEKVLERINEIKNGATPKVSPDSSAPSQPLSQQKGSRQTGQTPPSQIMGQQAQQARGQQQAGPQGQQQQKKVKLKNLTKTYSQALLKTNFGDIKVKFYAEDAPLTVNNFMNLAQEGFYNNTKFHRVIEDFMIQGGCPNSKDDDWSDDGKGGPGYRFKDEINDHKLVKGSLAMANSGPNTNGSQFFIVTADATPHLDGKHTNFGKVIDGMEVVEEIEQVDTNENDHPTTDVVVEGVELLK